MEGSWPEGRGFQRGHMIVATMGADPPLESIMFGVTCGVDIPSSCSRQCQILCQNPLGWKSHANLLCFRANLHPSSSRSSDRKSSMWWRCCWKDQIRYTRWLAMICLLPLGVCLLLADNLVIFQSLMIISIFLAFTSFDLDSNWWDTRWKEKGELKEEWMNEGEGRIEDKKEDE